MCCLILWCYMLYLLRLWSLQLICYHILVCFLIDLFSQNGGMNFLLLKAYDFVLLRSVNSVLFWRMNSCLRLTLCCGILGIHFFFLRRHQPNKYFQSFPFTYTDTSHNTETKEQIWACMYWRVCTKRMLCQLIIIIIKLQMTNRENKEVTSSYFSEGSSGCFSFSILNTSMQHFII
jgi:hypothetical protein